MLGHFCVFGSVLRAERALDPKLHLLHTSAFLLCLKLTSVLRGAEEQVPARTDYLCKQSQIQWQSLCSTCLSFRGFGTGCDLLVLKCPRNSGPL